MTLEQFRQHRTFDPIECGFWYPSNLLITVLSDGRFHLLIGACQWVSRDLSELEEKLHQFAIEEGHINAN